MARLSITQPARATAPTIPSFLAPSAVKQQQRYASVIRIKKKSDIKKKKPLSKELRRPRIEKTDFPQWSLVDALRYVDLQLCQGRGRSTNKSRVLRAYEVGQPPGIPKYEIHIHLKTLRNGPVIKSTMRLPNPVQSEWQIAVVAPENSAIASEAASAGARAVGEETLFEAIRSGKIDFDRLICHEDSEKKLQAAKLGPILGPKGLMPSAKMKTVTRDVVKAIRDSAGATEYKERLGNIRMAVGQLGHTPEQIRANIEAVVAKVKLQCATISEDHPKELVEIVFASTNSPLSFSLNGKFKDEDSKTTPAMVSGVM